MTRKIMTSEKSSWDCGHLCYRGNTICADAKCFIPTQDMWKVIEQAEHTVCDSQVLLFNAD